MNISKTRAQLWGAAAFLFAITISLASSSTATLVWFPVFRVFFLIICVCSLILLLAKRILKAEILASIFIILLTYSYGLMRSADQSVFSLTPVLVSFLMVSAGQFAFQISQEARLDKSLAYLYICFSLAVLIFLAFTGAITMAPYPAFRYELFAESGSRVSYSQGMSQFFGIAAIASFWLLRYDHSATARAALYTLVAAFILLSILGGARGETFFLMLILLALGYKNIKVILGFVVLFSVWFFSNLGQLDFFQSLELLSRFQEVTFDGYFGMRDILFSQAIDILVDDTKCLILGCGYFHFQSYYNYRIGLYPHNILLESFIVFGIFLTSMIVALAVIGFIKSRPLGFLGAVSLYAIIISMKSGDIVNSWIALTFIFFLAGKPLASAFSKKSDFSERYANAQIK